MSVPLATILPVHGAMNIWGVAGVSCSCVRPPECPQAIRQLLMWWCSVHVLECVLKLQEIARMPSVGVEYIKAVVLGLCWSCSVAEAS